MPSGFLPDLMATMSSPVANRQANSVQRWLESGVPAGDGSFSIVAEAAAAGKVKNRLVPCTNPGIPPVGLDTAILANFCRSFG